MAKIIGDLNINNGNLNIGTGTTIDNVLTDILVVDTSGTVKLRDVGTLAEGSSLSASTPYEFTTGTTEGSIQPSYSTEQGISNIGVWTSVLGGTGHTTTKSTLRSTIAGGQDNKNYGINTVRITQLTLVSHHLLVVVLGILSLVLVHLVLIGLNILPFLGDGITQY
jgi:hypothetical protein